MAIDSERQLGGVPDNVNEAWFDAMIRHQIGLLRVSGKIRNDILKILDETEADIAEQVRRRLKASQSVARQNATIKAISAIRNDAWKESAKVWQEELVELAKSEPEFLAKAIQTVSPAVLDMAIPSAALLRSIVTTRPFEGKVLKDWAQDLARADIDRMAQQVRIGVTQGETSSAIARRIVGTANLRGTNGVTEITRRNATAITRTAVNAIANQAKREFFKANADVFEEELYVATLDARTTAICKSLDGQTFPIGEGPIPPLHFNCRSLRVASIDGEAIGSRPMRQFTEQQLAREYSRANDLGEITSRAKLPRGHKGNFDTFARMRMRQLTGQIDAKVTYQEWLTRQSKEFQDDTLGQTKAVLFRKGKLPLTKFVNRQGDELSLSQLASREADAFRKAGLDPEDFR